MAATTLPAVDSEAVVSAAADFTAAAVLEVVASAVDSAATVVSAAEVLAAIAASGAATVAIAVSAAANLAATVSADMVLIAALAIMAPIATLAAISAPIVSVVMAEIATAIWPAIAASPTMRTRRGRSELAKRFRQHPLSRPTLA